MLIRQEVRLARLEVGEAALALGKGTAFVAVGGVIALLGGLSLLAGFVLLIGDQWLPRDLYWVAALIVVVVTGGIGAWLMMRGRAALSPRELMPDETVATLREDKEWLKRQLTSGATSS